MSDIPDYQMVRKIGEGAYGEIWLGISVTGVYRAIKFIRRDKFEHERPYEREFNGIKQYEPVSREHEGLVDILHIGRNEEKGYFYYVMELADDQHTGQEIDPATYKPKTLRSELTARENLPIPECLEQGAHLARALAHLHACGLAHRDVKPANIIYVKGKPRLADIGLVKALDDSVSFAGTIGYVPLEGPGRPTGDVFSLGKVLYEMLTGMDRTEFPTLPDSFKDDTRPGLQKLNQIVFKACEHKPDKRYQKADQLAGDLEQLIGQDLTTASASATGSLPVGKLVAAVAAVALVILGINQFKDLKETGEENSQPVGSAGEDKYAHLKKGLVAYYPFNGNAKDESGNKNNGEVKGPTLTAGHDGKENGAYKFSHGDDYIDIPNHPSLHLTNSMTISLWLKFDSFQPRAHTSNWILSKAWSEGDDGNSQIRHGLEMRTSGYKNRDAIMTGRFQMPEALMYKTGEGPAKGGLTKHGIPFSKLPLKKFFQVTSTYDGEYFRHYMDGELIAQSNKWKGSLDAIKGNLQIGQIKGLFLSKDKASSTFHHSFIGVADNVRLYNRALSEQEVKDLHEMERPKSNLNKGLVAYYPFNGNANDESGNNNDGEVKGATLTTGHDGKENGAYKFSNGADYINIPNHPSLSLNNSMTISIWLKLDSFGDGAIISKCWLDDFGDPLEVSPRRRGLRMHITNHRKADCLNQHVFERPGWSKGSEQAIPLAKLPLKRFFQVTYTFDGEYFRAYKDGLFFAMSNKWLGSLDANKGNIQIGQIKDLWIEGKGHTYHPSFFGVADNVRLYNRALSEQEVKELHEMEKPGGTIASISPKATTRGNFNLADLVEINGIYHHQETKKPVTGKITVIRNDPPPSEDKGDRIEFNLVNGIKHGRARRWYLRGGGTEWNAHDVVYQMGEVIKYQRWWPYEVQSKSPQLRYFVWKGTSSPWQVKKERWNQDGTPTKEHAATLNPSGQTYNIADTVDKNGIYYPKNSDKALTGRIVKMMQGGFQTEINVTNGIRDGLYRYWDTSDGKVSSDTLEGESVYQSGELIRHRSFTASSSASYNDTDKYWAGSSYPYQRKLKGWNRDGTPVTPLNKGLVAYYPFNGNAKDESGNGNHAENKGALPIGDRHGVKGKALSIGDTNKNAMVNLGKVLTGKSSCTISIWYRTDNKNNQTLVSTDQWYKPGAFNLGANSWHARWDFFVGNGSPTMIRDDGLPKNTLGDGWDHVVLVVEDGVPETFSLYVDGKLRTQKGSGATRVQVINGDLLIGKRPVKHGNENFQGAFDDIRLYDRALSKEEVKGLYNLERPKSGLEKGLAAYYPFNGNAKDESGNGNDGKVNGATLAADRHGKKDSSYQFDGVDDDIWVGQIKKISGSFEDQITISAWVKAASARTQEFTIIRKSAGKNIYDWGFGIDESGEVGFGVKTEDAHFSFKAPARPSEIVDKWAHVMAVRDSTNMYVFLNGKKIGQKPISGKMTNRSHSFNIGSIDSRGLHFAKGQIDDVRIYNRVLSEEEVKALYDLEKPKEK